MEFRRDINGLRAWAVVFVILYHFGIPGFGGGFVGVDIFFVISGYLMAGIIFSELNETTLSTGRGSFSLLRFYYSRAKRIIPPLLVLCFALIIVGWFLLSPTYFKMLGKHVVSAILFVSNFVFWGESGYFDLASHDKLLLHTWSLSVEWQFYLILPVVMLISWRVHSRRNTLIAVLGAVFLLSLAYSISITPKQTSEAFYLLPSRAWEMTAGALTYLIANGFHLPSWLKRTLEYLGFSLIIACLAVFSKDTLWPSWHALTPVMGTVLVILAGRQDSMWTGSAIAQRLGDWSYSLYLWHWPFVAALYYLLRQNQPTAIATGLAFTLALGWLSYRLVENPARKRLSRISIPSGLGAICAAVTILAFAGWLVQTQPGLYKKFPPEALAAFEEAKNRNPRFTECHVNGLTPVPECRYGGDQLGVIVLGDSHGEAMIRSIEKALPKKELYALDWTYSGCPTIAGIKGNDSSYRCGEVVKQFLTKQKSLPAHVPVVLISRMSVYLFGFNEVDRPLDAGVPNLYLTKPYPARSPEFLQEMREGLISTACELAKSRPVYMVRPTPEMTVNVPLAMGRALLLGKARDVAISIDEYHRRNAFAWETQDMAAKQCGVQILDPTPYLCDDKNCMGGVNGRPIYFDDDHLSERGGNLLIPMFRSIFNTADFAKQ